MANEDLGENNMKVLNYYQDRITKFIDKLENSDKKYTREDFPMKINMSIIGEEDILSNVIIDKNYSLLRKESEVYIYPTEMKELLEDKIEEKGKIIDNKKKMLYHQALNSLGLAFISSLIIISGLLISSFGEPTLKGFWGAVICKFIFMWNWGIIFSVFYFFFPEELEEQIKDFWLFVFAPVKAISIIIFVKNAIKYKKEASNYSQEDIELELNKLLKDLPQSVRNIVLAEKVSFY